MDDVSQAAFVNGYVDTIEVNKAEGAIKYNSGRVTTSLLDCGNKDWSCFSDGGLEFAIRYDWADGKKSWDFRDFNYSIIQNFDKSELEIKGNVYFILAKSKTNSAKPSVIYIYSENNGVVGFVMMLQGIDNKLIPVTYMKVSK